MTTTKDQGLENAALAVTLMQKIAKDRDFWTANMAEDVVLEFPFAPPLGFPSRIEGAGNARAYLDATLAAIDGLVFRDIEAAPMRDPDAVLLHYKGYSAPAGRPVYDQIYISEMRFRDGKLTLFREFWDSTIVLKALAHMIPPGAGV